MANYETYRGSRPSSAGITGKKGHSQPYLPPGWKPYVYKGDDFEEPRKPYTRKEPIEAPAPAPAGHGTVEGAENHLLAGEVPCFECAAALEDFEYEQRKKESNG